MVVAYGKLIPPEVLALFPKGMLNLHPSLLPRYRGPSPIQSAILNGDHESGVTLMLLDPEMDHGPLLAHRVSPLSPHTRGSDLSNALADDGAKLLVDALPKYISGELTPHPQDHTRATFTKLLEREDGRIDWRAAGAEQTERMIRAYDLWPGTWTTWNKKRLKILRASLLHPTIGCANNAKPGYVFAPPLAPPQRGVEKSPLLFKDGLGVVLAVNCSPGSLILEQLQPEGKKPLSASEFLRGSPKFMGSILL